MNHFVKINLLKFFFLIGLLILSGLITPLKTQSINVQVIITPPYSNKLEDYMNKGNNVVINLTNISQTMQQCKLIPALTGNNGVMVRVREDFLPSSPIILGPGETRTFTFNQLRVFNNNLQRNDITTQGIPVSIIENTGVLPEGTYTLCIKAIRYGGADILSGSTGGCASFHITSYDPPLILVPIQNAEIKTPLPQLVNFQWTPSGISGKTKYTLRIADITSLNIFNPNDAFNNPSVTPYFEQSNIFTTAFPYDMSKPKLFKNRQYAVQVIAYDPEGKISYKNEGKSQAHLFTVTDLGIVLPDTDTDKTKEFVFPNKLKDKSGGGDGGGNNPPTDPNDSQICMDAGACQIVEPSCSGSSSPLQGSLVNIGKFKMKVLDIQGGVGNGEIEIPHMQTKVEVSFQNLVINGNGEICGASMIWAKSANQSLIPDQMLKDIQGNYNDQNINWQNINQHIQQNNKKVSLFNVNQAPKTLPFVLDLGPGELTVLGMVFTPAAAYVNIAFSAPIPVGDGQQYFSMGMKGVCIRPNGFGISEADAKMSLGSDLAIQLGQNLAFVLNGGASGSYVRFDCKGTTEVKLKGGIEFDRNLVLPLDNNLKIVAAPTKFKANFDGTASGIKDWLLDAQASHPAVTATEGNGFKMGFEKLILDFSKTKNTQAMTFPENHPMANSPMKNSWTGIVLVKPTLTLPNYLKRSDETAIKVGISSIVLDGEGLWSKVAVQNIIDKLDDGSLGGWGFSITQLDLDIRKSELHGGGMSGAVNIPITDVGIGFSATYVPGTQNSDMEVKFGIVLQDKIDIDMIFASASLHESSTFGVTIEENKVKPNALLHGSISIGWDKKSSKKPEDNNNNDVSSFSLPSINFQGFSILNNKADLPQLNIQAMELANINQQGKLAGFPIKLSGNPGFTNNNNEIGFNLGLMFTLSKNNPNGLKGSTDFTIFAKYNPQKRRFAYDRTNLNCISIENLDIAVASISGSFCIFKNHDEFGDGFSGKIHAELNGLGVGIDAAIGLGNVNDFDYFYFEALVKTPGLPVTATMSLYGFGGGFYYNMERAKLQPIQEDQYKTVQIPDKPGPGYSPSGVKYTPTDGAREFNATVVFGLSGGVQSAAAFNGDLTFWMAFTKSNGISKMGLNGGGYLVQPLNNRSKEAAISGTFEIVIDFVNKSFDLGVNLKVNVANGIVHGNGDIVMHASKNEWFIYLGQWDVYANPNSYEPWNDEKRILVGVSLGPIQSDFNLYFMMGSIVPELPPLPAKLLANLGMQDGGSFQDPRKPNPTFNDKKPGFAFGAGFHKKIDINVLIFYANIEFFAGFDLLLAKKFSGDCEHLGINGWRAEGQAYAYLSVEAGLRLNLWIYEGDFKLIDIKVAALIYAQFPNPNYVYAALRLKAAVLGGLIKVDKQVKFEVGKKAKCNENSNPFSDLPIVSEIYPSGDDPVEVFDDIRVAFNYPRDVFKVFNEEFPDEPSRFYYYKIHKVELKKGNVNVPLEPEPIYTKDGYSAKFSTKNYEFFPENSELKFTIITHGFERLPGQDKLVSNEPPYVVNFTTKGKPDRIPASQMISANPTIRQRYFLQGDDYQGFVQTIKNYGYLLNKSNIGDPETFDQSKTEFLAEFTEMGSGKVIETQLHSGGQNIMNFIVPDELKGKTIYRLRLLARLHPKSKPIDKSKLGNFDLASNEGGTGSKETEIVKGAYKVNKYLLESKMTKTIDHDLASWYFQTSMYKTLQAKLADYKSEGSSTTTFYSKNLVPKVIKQGEKYSMDLGFCDECVMPRYTLPVAFVTGKEAFDQYDLYGYSKLNGQDDHFVYPKIGFEATEGPKAYHETYYEELNDALHWFKESEVACRKALKLDFRRDYGDHVLKDNAINSNIREVWPINSNTYNRADAVWTIYSKHKYYFSDLSIPKGKSLWVPEGPLTKKEIDDAVASTNFEKEGGSGLLNIKIKGSPPAGKDMMNQNLNLNSNVTPLYAFVNMGDFLAFKDYNNSIRNSWYWTSPNNKYIVNDIQNRTLPYLYRNKGNYNVRIGSLTTNKTFQYTWNINKPNP